MKAWVWRVVALVGFGVMLGAYVSRERIDSKAPWASGMIVISSEASAEKTWRAGAIPARLRLLSSSDVAEILLFASGDMPPNKALGVKGQVRVKLIELPLAMAGIGAAALQSGRLPDPGRDEVVAGAGIEPRETLSVGGRSLKVVGVLKPDLALFASSYLVPVEAVPTDATNKLFPAEVPTVLHAWLVHASAAELRDPKIRKELEEVFPPEKYAWVTPLDRLEPRSFYLYLSGLAIFLLGGSGTLIGLFRWLAGKVGSPVVAGPLLEMRVRPRLVWSVHVVYFGLVIAGSLLVFKAPEAQVVLLDQVREGLATKSNPLGIAGEAYSSGNIPRAIVTTFLVNFLPGDPGVGHPVTQRAPVVTFLVNFLLGALASIMLPSMLLPASGVVVAALRALACGLILAPAMQPLALAMLPHCLTILLAGEGYILATLFGLLIPIHVVQRSLGGNVFTRFGRALLLNFKAQFWIALVLAVAAIYEATEVILMNL